MMQPIHARGDCHAEWLARVEPPLAA